MCVSCMSQPEAHCHRHAQKQSNPQARLAFFLPHRCGGPSSGGFGGPGMRAGPKGDRSTPLPKLACPPPPLCLTRDKIPHGHGMACWCQLVGPLFKPAPPDCWLGAELGIGEARQTAPWQRLGVRWSRSKYWRSISCSEIIMDEEGGLLSEPGPDAIRKSPVTRK